MYLVLNIHRKKANIFDILVSFDTHDFVGYRRWNRKARTLSLRFMSITYYSGSLIEEHSALKKLVEEADQNGCD